MAGPWVAVAPNAHPWTGERPRPSFGAPLPISFRTMALNRIRPGGPRTVVAQQALVDGIAVRG